jgi:hypothetical protein
MKKNIYSICLFGLFASCLFHSKECFGGDYWGKAVQDVKLTINMTNDVFLVGSSVAFEAVITNASAVPIIVDKNFTLTVIIKNDEGNSFDVTASKMILYPIQPVPVPPGERYTNFASATFEQNVEPGDYTLHATQTFQSNNKHFTLESNLIKIKIVK